MYASAILHWTTLLLNVIGYYNVARAYAAQLLRQSTSGDTCRLLCPIILALTLSCTMISFGIPGSVHGLTVCAPTALLTLNVRLPFSIGRHMYLNRTSPDSPWRRCRMVACMGHLASQHDRADNLHHSTRHGVWYAHHLPRTRTLEHPRTSAYPTAQPWALWTLQIRARRPRSPSFPYST